VGRGVDATPFDHTSLLRYLIEKWDLGPLGNRTAHANSIGRLIQTTARNLPFVPIRLTRDQEPRPDLESAAASHISTHHKAMVLLAVYLQLEFLKKCPLLYAWLTYALEIALHGLFSLAGSPIIRIFHRLAKFNTARLIKKKKRQAIPRLKAIIQDAGRSRYERHHAAETLACAVNQRFHNAPDPVEAAETWLRARGL
jgi:hypothetical protein